MRNHKKSIALLFLILLNFSCVSVAKPGKIVYLIPAGFSGGGVIIVFNQPDGITPETDKDGTLIFHVPQDGLVKLKEPYSRTVYNYQYYFVDEQGKRMPIEYLYPEHYVKNPGDTTTRNFNEVTKDESKNKVFTTQHRTVNFYVGKEKTYIESFIVEKPAIALQTYLKTGDRMFDIQEELLRKEKAKTEQPQN